MSLKMATLKASLELQVSMDAGKHLSPGKLFVRFSHLFTIKIKCNRLSYKVYMSYR